MYGNQKGMASGLGSMGGGQDCMASHSSMTGGVSMYGGMGCKSMVSLYGMGGSMDWMYGMGGTGYMMARSMSFSSYGGGNIYGSIGGSSLMKIGGSAYSIGGMWGAESGTQVRRHPDCDMPTVAKALQDDDATRRCLVLTTATKQTDTNSQLPVKGAAAAATNGAKAAEEDKEVASGVKSKSEGDNRVIERAKQEIRSRAASSTAKSPSQTPPRTSAGSPSATVSMASLLSRTPRAQRWR